MRPGELDLLEFERLLARAAGRSRPIARRRSARLFRSGAERRSQTLRTSSSSSRRRRASRSCAGLRWRRGSRPSWRSDGGGARTRARVAGRRASVGGAPARAAHARPVQGGPAGRRSRRVPRRQAGARRRAGSRAGRAASRARARDPPPGPCAIGYGGGRAVQLDRRSIGATGRARATPSTRRSARPWSGGSSPRADRSARGDRIRDEDARRGSSRPPCTRRRRACGSVLIFVACRGRRPAHDTPGCRPAAARDRGRSLVGMFAVVFAEAACDVAAMVEWGWNQ